MTEDDANLQDSDPEQPEPEQDDGFSLEALSEAYARAVAEQNAGTESTEPVGDAMESDDASETEEIADAEELGESAAEDTAVEDHSADMLLDEESDNAPCEISPKSILEAMLFVATPDGSAMKNRNLAALMRGVSPKEVTQLTHELNDEYEASGAAYRIQRDGGGYRMVLGKQFEPVRQRFYGEVKEARLSQPAIDVLSVVAYNQPLTKEKVDTIRAKPSGPILLQLVRRGLLSREKTETTPRQTLFQTTDRFLELFGLETLEDLPQTQNVELADES